MIEFPDTTASNHGYFHLAFGILGKYAMRQSAFYRIALPPPAWNVPCYLTITPSEILIIGQRSIRSNSWYFA